MRTRGVGDDAAADVAVGLTTYSLDPKRPSVGVRGGKGGIADDRGVLGHPAAAAINADSGRSTGASATSSALSHAHATSATNVCSALRAAPNLNQRDETHRPRT